MKKLNKRYIVYGVGLLLLAAILRVVNLTSLPVFADEAIYIRWSQVMRAVQDLRFLPLSDGKQPLFMWVTIPFLKVFRDPLFAGRFVSVLAGISAVIGIWFLSYLLFKKIKVSFFASLIYAISPYAVFFDRLALADSLLSMFGVWTLVFAVITVKKVRLDSAMISGFFLGGALLTKSPGLYFALLTPISLLFSSWPKKIKAKFSRASVFVFLFSFTFVIGYGLYSILRLGPNFQMIAIRNLDYVYPLNHLLVSPLDPLKPFLIRSLEWYWNLGPAPIFLLLVLGAVATIRNHKKELVLLLVWTFIPWFISAEFAKTFTARYILFSLPYFAILASSALLSNKLEKVRNLVIILFVFLSIFTDLQFLTDIEKAPLPRSERSGYLEEWTAGTGIKEVADYLRDEYLKNPNEKIVVGTEGYFGTLPDGLQIYLNDLPEITVIGVGEPIRSVPQQLSEAKKAGDKTFLVVNNTRFLADADKLNLKLDAAYAKAVQPDGFREALLFYELTTP